MIHPPEGSAAEASRTLADRLRTLSGDDELSVVERDGRVVIQFAESEFIINLCRPAPPARFIDVTGVIRSPAPSLDTWWFRWSVPPRGDDLARTLLAEVRRERRRFQRLVQENVRRDQAPPRTSEE